MRESIVPSFCYNGVDDFDFTVTFVVLDKNTMLPHVHVFDIVYRQIKSENDE